jgi:hypothetical protein
MKKNKSSDLYDPNALAPMLQFGSVLKDDTLLPHIQVYPFPPYLTCLDEWYFTKTELCTSWDINYQDSQLEWNKLIPQVIWRGRMYQFLETLDVAFFNQNNLTKVPGPSFLPRQLAVNMSLYAATMNETLNYNLTTLNQSRIWLDIQDGNIQYVSHTTMSKYRYQIDFGGAGGTTWTGTLEKLSMPGLLFHHETPAKDWYYDKLIPWKHYVPIRTDLSDLKEKFHWAVDHDREAQRIAAAGTQLAKELLSSSTMAMYYETFFGNNSLLAQLVEWYIPTNKGERNESMESILHSYTHNHGLHVKGPFAMCDKAHCTINYGTNPIKFKTTSIFQWRPPKRKKHKSQSRSIVPKTTI